MKLVLDTNVLVSALFWDGSERAVLVDCIDGEHELVTSPFILEELGSVLRRKFDVPAEKVASYIRLLLPAAFVVDPDPHVEVVDEDPPDDRILEAAVAAQADAIVSGDSHLLKLEAFEGIEICPASDVSSA